MKAPEQWLARLREVHAFSGVGHPTRWFHLINALAVFGLIAVGLGLLYDDALGLSASGKVLLKQVHVSIGYVLTLNFIWRFIWAFLGNRYARWCAILPFGTGYSGSHGVMPMPF